MNILIVPDEGVDMFRTRRLGVKEGNAIDDIVAYEMKCKRGTATAKDKLAHDAACRSFGIPTAVTATEKRAPQPDTLEEEWSFDYTGHPGILRSYGDALVVVGAMFVLFALSFVLLYMLVWAVNGFVSLAHP